MFVSSFWQLSCASLTLSLLPGDAPAAQKDAAVTKTEDSKQPPDQASAVPDKIT